MNVRLNGARPSAASHTARTNWCSLNAVPELGPLVVNWAQGRSRAEIAALAVDQIPRAFGTTTCAVALADTPGTPGELAVRGMQERDCDAYECIWRPHDVLLAKVLVEQVPLTLGQAQDYDAWRRAPFYLEYAKRFAFVEGMQAPLYGAGGVLSGVVYFARSARYGRFNAADLRRATVLAGYLSASVARVSAQHFGGPASQSIDLTKRERELVSLVAQGLNNLEIAAALQIARETVKQTLRRIYRKLEVNGRAQMMARLAELGWF